MGLPTVVRINGLLPGMVISHGGTEERRGSWKVRVLMAANSWKFTHAITFSSFPVAVSAIAKG